MCKEVGGYLTRYARIAASVALNDESLMNERLSQYLCRYKAAKKEMYYLHTTGKKDNHKKMKVYEKKWAITKQNIVLTLQRGITIDAQYLTFYQYNQQIQQLLKECKESK